MLFAFRDSVAQHAPTERVARPTSHILDKDIHILQGIDRTLHRHRSRRLAGRVYVSVVAYGAPRTVVYGGAPQANSLISRKKSQQDVPPTTNLFYIK